MRSVLCFGDSNTWGAATVPRPDERYGPEERWPGIARAALGSGWLVIEEGLNGRTTVREDPIEGRHLNGSAYLVPALLSHKPLDAVVVALGANDLKARFNVSAYEIGAGIGVLLQLIAASGAGRGGVPPKVLVVVPPPLLPEMGGLEHFLEMFAGAYEKSLQLPHFYRLFAAEHGAAVFEAGSVIKCSTFDGLHFDPDAHAALGTAIAAELVRLVG